jgi:ActR/RegA family two-component response regulator
MSEKPNWHDAHTLMLIDRALEQGTFTAELVAQINQALAAARQADPTHRPAPYR